MLTSVPQILAQGILKEILYFTDVILSHVLCTEVIKKYINCSRHRPGVAQRVGKGIAVLFHDRGTRRW